VFKNSCETTINGSKSPILYLKKLIWQLFLPCTSNNVAAVSTPSFMVTFVGNDGCVTPSRLGRAVSHWWWPSRIRVARFLLVHDAKTGKNVPNEQIMYQMVMKYPYVCIIFQMDRTNINTFQSEALQNLPKLGFSVWKPTIWQPCWWWAPPQKRNLSSFGSRKKLEATHGSFMYNTTQVLTYLGSMLWSRFSTTFRNFQQKNWRFS
jgi:hypothetical protein